MIAVSLNDFHLFHSKSVIGALIQQQTLNLTDGETVREYSFNTRHQVSKKGDERRQTFFKLKA